MKKLTAKEWVEKFYDEDTQINTDYLVDIACPECGERDDFVIETRCFLNFQDDHYEIRDQPDLEPDDYIRCRNCDASKDIRIFTVNGLDELIEKKREDDEEEDEDNDSEPEIPTPTPTPQPQQSSWDTTGL